MSESLADAIARTRPVLEAGIADAERELEEWRRRVEDLEMLIARARALLSGNPATVSMVGRRRLYLHEAMLLVLRDEPKRAMRAPFLASEINRRRLYLQRDGSPVRSREIHARVARYPGLFRRTTRGIEPRW